MNVDNFPPGISDGWLDGAERCLSPNFDTRPAGGLLDLLVIHNISLPPGNLEVKYIQDLFLNRLNPSDHPYFETIKGLRVSAHLLIDRGGVPYQFVSFNDRAWHAGVSRFMGRDRCNDFSVGVELVGDDFTPFTAAQYKSLSQITLAIQKNYGIKFITGHEHIAPNRKTDPGPKFDWGYYGNLLSKIAIDPPRIITDPKIAQSY